MYPQPGGWKAGRMYTERSVRAVCAMAAAMLPARNEKESLTRQSDIGRGKARPNRGDPATKPSLRKKKIDTFDRRTKTEVLRAVRCGTEGSHN